MQRGQVVVPAAQPLLGPGDAPVHQRPAGALAPRLGVDVAAHVGPLEGPLRRRVPDPHPPGEAIAAVGRPGVDVEVEERRGERLLELVDRQHAAAAPRGARPGWSARTAPRAGPVARGAARSRTRGQSDGDHRGATNGYREVVPDSPDGAEPERRPRARARSPVRRWSPTGSCRRCTGPMPNIYEGELIDISDEVFERAARHRPHDRHGRSSRSPTGTARGRWRSATRCRGATGCSCSSPAGSRSCGARWRRCPVSRSRCWSGARRGRRRPGRGRGAAAGRHRRGASRPCSSCTSTPARRCATTSPRSAGRSMPPTTRRC